VIGFLRLIGIMNAAVWLGGAVFFTTGASPALFSPAMEKLLGASNFPYFAVAIEQVVLTRYFHFLTACAVIALLHLMAEWLYLGRPSRKFSFSLLAALFVFALFCGNWLQPRLKELHAASYASNVQPAFRETAAKSFRTWHAISGGINILMIGGLVVYMWRVANPSDTPRFISSVKFRG
jgi:hypothetical protein